MKSASAEVLGVPEDCGPIRPLASKRHWQREAKAQTLRRTRRLVREGIRLRALPATDSDCRCSVHHMTWRPPSPPKPIASWGFGARPVKNQSSTGSHRHRSRHRSHHRTPSWRHQRAIPGRKTPLVFVGIFSTGSLDRFARTLRTPQCRARCSLLGRACSQRCPTLTARRRCPGSSACAGSCPARRTRRSTLPPRRSFALAFVPRTATLLPHIARSPQGRFPVAL